MLEDLIVSSVASDGGMDAETSRQCAIWVVDRALNFDGVKPSLVSRIATEVGAQIIEGDYAPGDDLNSVDLSHRYQTSRTPVREALMLLEKEGLVVIPPRRRPRVVSFDVKDVRDIYRTRCALLEFIAADVARKATDDDIAALEGMCSRMALFFNRDDRDAYLWSNVSFHDMNTDLSGNRTVKRIIDSLLLRTLPLRRMSLSTAPAVQQSLEDHRLLVRAYRDRDPNLAAAILRSNHMRSLRRLENSLTEPNPGPRRSSEGEATSRAAQ